MRCEVCGRKILGIPYKAIIEGAKLTVCKKCSRHGEIVWEEKPSSKVITPKLKAKIQPLRFKTKKPLKTIETNLEVVDNFDVKIREAREYIGLSHEELGKKIGEKVSVIKKIETRKIMPDHKLVAKLEHALKIKLLVSASKEKSLHLNIPKPTNRELTLGDLIQLNKKSKQKEDTAQRGP